MHECITGLAQKYMLADTFLLVVNKWYDLMQIVAARQPPCEKPKTAEYDKKELHQARFTPSCLFLLVPYD